MTKKEEEFWKLAQEMLAQKDFSRIKELEELNEQHRKLNGKLRDELNFKVDYQNQVIDYMGKLLENRTQERVDLQERIDKANEILSKILVVKQGDIYRPIKNTTSQDVYKTIVMLNDILDTPYRAKYKGEE